MAEKVTASKAQKIADIKGLIEGLVHTKRSAYSRGSRPEMAQTEIDRIQKRIERDQREVERLKHELVNWKEIVNDADERIAELRQELLALENEKAIDRLMKAQTQIQELVKAGYTLEQIKAAMGG